LIVNPSSIEIKASLRTIMEHAGEISYKLWTQRSYVVCYGLAILLSPFNHASDYLKAHSFHGGDLFEDEKALDGWKVLLVTHPAVVVHGDSRGTDYSRKRILKKAVVWMGDSYYQNQVRVMKKHH
jgi:hypothetical protein